MMNIFHAEWRTVTPRTISPYGGDYPAEDIVVNDIQEGSLVITAGSEDAVEYAVKQLYPGAKVTVKHLGAA